VSQLVSWCRLGPPAAEVDGIELDELPVSGDRAFRVTR
jgi:hypothetical protein